MKKYFAFASALLFASMIGCQEKEDPILEEPKFEETESEWIRLASWNESSRISLITPVSGDIAQPDLSAFQSTSANYVSSTGRYIVSIERADGNVRFFDTGIENHDDHGHAYAPKWLSSNAAAPLPTHFSSTNGNIIIFNDGDGTVTFVREANMEVPSFTPTVIANIGNGVHHGAASWLKGNKLAVTFKDEGTAGALPQRVKIINTTGQVLYEKEGVSVTGIHGDASNGDYVVFGGTEGVILASSDNQISLIPNPSPLESTSGNWMGTIKANDNVNKFYGYARNHGVFEIDPAAGTIKPTFLSNNIKTYLLSADGGHLIVQTNDNVVKVFDTTSGNELASKTVTVAENVNAGARKGADELEHYRMMSEGNPVLTASENYLYVLEADKTKIHVRNLKTLNTVAVMDAPSGISNIMRVGFQVK
ncbi:hypothetical protein MM213_06870 [Belliella sp. R4-6]|uniref:Uncharacterized protein n=1 Tax=Belliella alkalica TaxID=1730871 RepID=A0ABS9VAC6_9BACT|nr:hypothetical protein [Belliella alkalica]MCH7413199.1 hypothetical protein [Belliella alkalica]